MRATCGLALIVFSALCLLMSTYAIAISKIIPKTGVWFLDLVADDVYYCLLVPLIIIPSVLVVYLNWLGMKFYRHN